MREDARGQACAFGLRRRDHKHVVLGVDDDHVVIAQRTRPLGRDDGHDGLVPGQDRGVRRRTTADGDEGEHLLKVQSRGVGRGQITRDEHEGMAGVRNTRSLHPEDLGDDALRDVVDVDGALRHVTAQGGQLRAVGGVGLVHTPLCRLARRDPGVDVALQHRVLGEHRLGLEHLGCRTAGEPAATPQLGGDRSQSTLRSQALGVRADRTGDVERFWQRIGHAHNRADGDPGADACAAHTHESTPPARAVHGRWATDADGCAHITSDLLCWAAVENTLAAELREWERASRPAGPAERLRRRPP